MSLKPAQANRLGDPISKTLHKNRASGVAQGKGPEFKPQYHQNKEMIYSFNKTVSVPHTV
jgi:hypothetical protein